MFIDSANSREIKALLETGIFKGVTTNPSLIRRTELNRFVALSEILDVHPKTVFVQIIGSSFTEMKDDFSLIQAFAQDKQVDLVVKTVINQPGIKLISRIKEAFPDQQILGTAVYSANQGIIAALAGCDYIAPYVNRMETNRIDAAREIRLIRQFVDDRRMETKIMAASFKNTEQVIRSLEAGAHTATLAYDIALAMMDNKLAELAIDDFNRDGLM